MPLGPKIATESDTGNKMTSFFGVAGPKGVEIIPHPTRNNLKISSLSGSGGSAMPSFHKDTSDETKDNFDVEVKPAPSSKWGKLKKLQAAKDEAVNMRPSTFSSVSSMYTADVSHRFTKPLVSEGEGSVFPVDLPIHKRRGFEVEIIHRFDTLKINRNIGEFWFLIDSIWMGRWIKFVMGKEDPPGPISNSNLFEHLDYGSNSKQASLMTKHAAGSRMRSGVLASRPDLKIKQSLKKVEHYRAVHPLIWYLFRELYDTDDAPEVCRWKADLYSAEVAATRKNKLEQETHTKAVYELRRFCARIKEVQQQLGSNR